MVSSLGLKSPKQKINFFTTGEKWLQDRKEEDGAENLWRIHDDLYDVTDFVKNHPGGSFWLDVTKGTDITAAFEVHHISTLPERILQEFHVRKAKTPRVSPFTFKDDGFYRTLKSNVRQALKNIPKTKSRHTANLTDILLCGTFAFAILANMYWNLIFAVISGLCWAFVTVAGHNYFHQKDNFRMYYFDFSMLQSREWRIIHVLSHHLLTNTVIDLQLVTFEPFIVYLPKKKSFALKYGPWIYVFVVWLTLFYFSFVKKVVLYFVYKYYEALKPSDILPFTIPLAMYIFGKQPLLSTIYLWMLIMGLASLVFGFIGFTVGHQHPEVFHDGDKPRAENDWAYSQLDTLIERSAISSSYLLGLINFGDHALHHLFPTLDHGIVGQLYPVFEKTAKLFNGRLRMSSQFDILTGHFRQVARTEPNPKPPR